MKNDPTKNANNPNEVHPPVQNDGPKTDEELMPEGGQKREKSKDVRPEDFEKFNIDKVKDFEKKKKE